MTRAESQERTRRALLEAADRRFEEHGYLGTTLAEVAAWCGIGPVPDPDTAAQPASIRTASFAQARQPVGTGSIGRWRTLAPLLPNICIPD